MTASQSGADDVDDLARNVETANGATSAPECTGAVARPPLVCLRDLLAIADSPEVYLVDGLWPRGGNVVLAAQAKVGKTTLTYHLVRCLVDGQLFLGQFSPRPTSGSLVVIDCELSERQLRRWMRAQGIGNDDRVHIAALRGRVREFDILNPAVRIRWAAELRALECQVLILDCLRPVLDALALSEDKDAGRFFLAWETMLLEAGVGESLIVHHMGHEAGRSRGDTRIRDWPDVEWTYGKSGDSRSLKAFGRDVDVSAVDVEYSADTRSLSISERRSTAPCRRALLELLRDEPRLSQRQLIDKLSYKRATVLTTVDAAIASGEVMTEEGPRNSQLHSLAPSAHE